MLTAALPYMLQLAVMGNANECSHSLFSREVVRGVRIHTFFPTSAQGSESTLLAAVQGSKYTVDAYTDAFNHIVSMCSDTVRLHLFTLPKVRLLFGMLIHQQWFGLNVVDWISIC